MIRLRPDPVFGFLLGLRRDVVETRHQHAEAPTETHRQARSEGGFTLIEVLVALVVVTAGLTVIAQGFLTGGRASVASQHRSIAAMLAESKMAEIEAGIISNTTSASGTFEPERPDFTWNLELESTTITGLTQITLTVLWKERGEETSFALTRLMKEARSE